MDLQSIKSVLGLRPKGDTSEALKQAKADAEARQREILGSIAALKERQGDVLLDGDEATIGRLDSEIAALQGDFDRVTAMVGALPTRIAAAEARENARRLDAVHAEADRVSADTAAIAAKIFEMSEELAALVEQHDDAMRRIRAANEELKAGGRHRVPAPIRRMWPDEPSGGLASLLAPGLMLPTPFGPRGAGHGLFGTVGLLASVRHNRERAERTRLAAE